MSVDPSLHLFEGVGVELEYMIVDTDSLDVQPCADEVLKAVNGGYVNEVERGSLNWSNELALHVIELKTAGPAPSLDGLAAQFHQGACGIQGLLEPMHARLMPTAMHPWMDPFAEMRLWPHSASPIYEAFHRIFDCRGHGWANLQSMHLNLPFQGDEEFARLHAAIRLVLPVLPALAASSPIVDGKVTGCQDFRLEAYRNNCRRIPSVTGRVIPEDVFTANDYQERVLAPMYLDIAPLDPGSVLQEEWLNARGAIARFDRDTIEIRIIDVQECPLADLAIAALTIAVIKALVAERWTDLSTQKQWGHEALEMILLDCIRDGENAVITNREYLECFGWEGRRHTAGELWRHLYGELRHQLGEYASASVFLISHGTLARRIVAATGPAPDRARLHKVYERLCECLGAGEFFDGAV